MKDGIKTNNLRLLLGGRKERSRAREKGGQPWEKACSLPRLSFLFQRRALRAVRAAKQPAREQGTALPLQQRHVAYFFISSVPQMAGSGVEPPPQRELEGRALNVPPLLSPFAAWLLAVK